MTDVSHFITLLTILVLAIFVGFRSDLQSADDAAHAADVGHERDPRHRRRRRNRRNRRAL